MLKEVEAILPILKDYAHSFSIMNTCIHGERQNAGFRYYLYA